MRTQDQPQAQDQEQERVPQRAQVTKLVGAPGSGKTTNQLRLVRDELRNGTALEDILFCTFTRAARSEVEDRLLAIAEEEGVIDDDDTDTDPTHGIRTVHGAALKACLGAGALELRNRDNLDDHGQLLIRRTDDRDSCYFEWFFGQHFPTIEYDPEGDDPIERLQAGGWDDTGGDIPAGNRIMALYDYLQSKDWPLNAYHRAPISEGIELPDPVILDVLTQWETFKDENDLIQDDDYVQTALEHQCPPPGRVLFVDEFQDLSSLQNHLYEMWRDSGDVDRVYIAGDPHQAVYGFRGADPTYFTETVVDRTIRDETSKRCPQAVIDAAVPIAAPVPEHDVSRVDSQTDGGVVEHLDIPTPDALASTTRTCVDEHGEVYLIARTNRQARKIAYGLRRGGLPYLDVSPSGALQRWRYPAPAFLAAARGLNAGEPLPVPTLALLLEHSTSADARAAVQASLDSAGDDSAKRANAVAQAANVRLGSVVPARTYRDWYPEVKSGRGLVGQLTIQDWLHELLVDALESRATHDPEDVRVGTVHAAKGLGAECVLVFPAYSHKQLERYHKDRSVEAEERRLFYVAMTRARQTVLVAHEYFDGEEFPPLAR